MKVRPGGSGRRASPTKGHPAAENRAPGWGLHLYGLDVMSRDSLVGLPAARVFLSITVAQSPSGGAGDVTPALHYTEDGTGLCRLRWLDGYLSLRHSASGFALPCSTARSGAGRGNRPLTSTNH